MSTANAWDWLISECRTKKRRFIPSTDGEPWVTYETLADVMQFEVSYIEKIVSKNKIRKHPIFAGLTKFSFFELVDDGECREGRARLQDPVH